VAPIARWQCHVYCPVKPGSLYKRGERCSTLDWGQQVFVYKTPQDDTAGKLSAWLQLCMIWSTAAPLSGRTCVRMRRE
jgi:hypothetical protein